MSRPLSAFSFLFALAAFTLPAVAAPAAPAATTGWDAVPAILARIKAPTFPARDFPITDFGARAEEANNNGDAIARAIAAAHAAGGGRVVVPAGTWRTGPVHLKSNVNLHVSEGATLQFIPDSTLYPNVLTRWEGVECYNHSPLIYALDQENIAVTGRGTLDGSSTKATWWGWVSGWPFKQTPAATKLRDMGDAGVPVDERVFGEGNFLRPTFIEPYRCRNVLIEGVTVRNSPMWMVHPVLCTNVTVRGVSLVSHGSNNDGCNPESCRDVLIEDCLFDTGDDCIAIKSGRNNDGRRINVASENIIIRRNQMKEGHGGVVIGSEISGHCRNVFIEDCAMDSPELNVALRFKNNAVRGGVVENIFMRNVTIGQVKFAVVRAEFFYGEGAKGPHRPVLRNVQLENVTSSASPRVLWLEAFPNSEISGIALTDCKFEGVKQPDVLVHTSDVHFTRVTVPRPAPPPAAPATPPTT